MNSKAAAHGFDLSAPMSRRALLGRPSLLLAAMLPGLLPAAAPKAGRTGR